MLSYPSLEYIQQHSFVVETPKGSNIPRVAIPSVSTADSYRGYMQETLLAVYRDPEIILQLLKGCQCCFSR
jgi:hypothetical protein